MEEIDYLFATPEVQATIEIQGHGQVVEHKKQNDAECSSETVERISD